METNVAGYSANDGWPKNIALREWFRTNFPQGPTRIQQHAWPVLELGLHALLIAPTGTGKTWAAFLGVIDRLLTETVQEPPTSHVRCIYVSPLKSLANDVRSNLERPLQEIAKFRGVDDKDTQVRIGIRTGDTSPYERAKLRKDPPQILITTPESLSILLSQRHWVEAFRWVETLVVDEIHSLAASRRGSDLALSLERLSAGARKDPTRIGLSATCHPVEMIGNYLVGMQRDCRIVDVSAEYREELSGKTELRVESLIRADEAAYRPLVHQRLVERLKRSLGENRTTVVFANTRPLTERVTFLLKDELKSESSGERVAAHHGSLDAAVRCRVEQALKQGAIDMVVSSTSLELGVDYPSADYVVQFGLPGSVSRCLQRLGRGGHEPGRNRRGVILASHPAELAAAVVTANAASGNRIEPISIPQQPLDVLCQHLVGQACSGVSSIESFFKTVRRAWPFRELSRPDFEACLNYLCGELSAPSGACESDVGGELRWTAPRLRKSGGRFRVNHGKVARWFRMNVGTIDSEETFPVEADGIRIGHLETAFADRLDPGDRFVLDGRALKVRRIAAGVVEVKDTSGEANFPVWTSDRPGLSGPLASELGRFREKLGRILADSDDPAANRWLVEKHSMREADAECLIRLWRSQMAVSEIPPVSGVLFESFPENEGWGYAVHGTLHKSAAECMGRAFAARIGRVLNRDIRLSVADLGFVVHTECELLDRSTLLDALCDKNLDSDVLEGLDRGELIARRFRQVASTGLMVMRNHEGGRPKVGGMDWVIRRLYPVVAESCPDHPLIRESRREVLESQLDIQATRTWSKGLKTFRFRRLPGISPFASAWLEPFGDDSAESVRFESEDDVLRRLHQRLFAPSPELAS